MREIKFDIMLWDGENPDTIEHYNLEEAVKEDFVKLNPVEGHDGCIIVREFTGLKADNIDIYEDDIIEWSENVDGSGRKFRSVMQWVINDGDITSSPFINSTSKVIGNIWENEGLLDPL